MLQLTSPCVASPQHALPIADRFSVVFLGTLFLLESNLFSEMMPATSDASDQPCLRRYQPRAVYILTGSKP